MTASLVNAALQQDVGQEVFFNAVRRDTWANRRVWMFCDNSVSLTRYCSVNFGEGDGILVYASKEAADEFAKAQAQKGNRIYPDASSIERVMDLAEEKFHMGVYLCGDNGFCRMFDLEEVKQLRALTLKVRKGGDPFSEQTLFMFHNTSYGNGEAVRIGKPCGCFHCIRMFEGAEVTRFIRESDGSETALCPYCGVDSVITDYRYYRVSMSWLERLNQRFFGSEDDSEVPLSLKLEYLAIMRQMAAEKRKKHDINNNQGV